MSVAVVAERVAETTGGIPYVAVNRAGVDWVVTNTIGHAGDVHDALSRLRIDRFRNGDFRLTSWVTRELGYRDCVLSVSEDRVEIIGHRPQPIDAKSPVAAR